MTWDSGMKPRRASPEIPESQAAHTDGKGFRAFRGFLCFVTGLRRRRALGLRREGEWLAAPLALPDEGHAEAREAAGGGGEGEGRAVPDVVPQEAGHDAARD